MGLDVSVYRRKSLTPQERERAAGFDPQTGAPLDADGHELLGTEAYEARLGNIAAIASARDGLARADVDAPILARVIANGTVAGWHIPLEQLPALRAEIAALRGHPADGSLAHVLECLDKAAQIAAAEGTPIAF